MPDPTPGPAPAQRTLDVAIVGAGIAGIIHLHHARRAGLDAVVLEARSRIGGLWAGLPAWQDIQISCADWTLGDLPPAGPQQPQIVANIEAWAQRFGLADGIGAAPWAYQLIARSIMSHIRGTAQLDWVQPGHKINHLEIVRLLGARDAGSYPEGRGWAFYRRIALDTPDDVPYPPL